MKSVRGPEIIRPWLFRVWMLASLRTWNIGQRAVHDCVKSAKDAKIEDSETLQGGQSTPTSTTPLSTSSLSSPWYLRQGETVNKELAIKEPFPELPKNAPERLHQVIKYSIEELGLVDLKVIDLRSLKPATPLGPDAIVVIATGKSDRHLKRACSQFLTYLKKSFSATAKTDGILTANFLQVHQRRLKRRAARRTKLDSEMFNSESGLKSTGAWVIVETGMDGIFVNIMTKDRRDDLKLESLWGEEISRYSQSERALANDPKQNRFQRMYFEPETVSSSIKTRGFHTLCGRRHMYSLGINAGSVSTAVPLTDNLNVGNVHANIIDTNTPPYKKTTPDVISTVNLHSMLGNYKEAVKAASQLDDRSPELVTTVLRAHINHLATVTDVTRLNQKSDEVSSFINAFPVDATADHWKLRLLFLHKVHVLNPTAFPLEMFLEHAIYQQACGIPVEPWDVELIVSTIVYANQFDKVSPSPDSAEAWQQQCSRKLDLILKVYDATLRPAGTLLLSQDSMAGLLYRLFISPGPGFFSANEAMQNPDSESFQIRAYVDDRSNLVLQLLKEEHMNKPMVGLILTALANGGNFEAFWAFWYKYATGKQVDFDMVCLLTSLVAKSGNQQAIGKLLDRALPLIIAPGQEEFLSRPNLRQAISSCLRTIDPHEIGHASLRQLLKRFD